MSLSEKFDFSSINSKKKPVSIYPEIRQIIEKIDNKPFSKITKSEKNILLNIFLPDNFYDIGDSHKHLKEFIYKVRKIQGEKCNLNWINVSHITNMSYLFSYTDFNGDISRWDVSNVTDMSYMFHQCNFNGDISSWNVSNVTNMRAMFCESKFNKDISNWDVSNVIDMEDMFCESKFNKDISNWDVSNVVNMSFMFCDSVFNKDISGWDVSNVVNMDWMFDCSKFNGNIDGWKINDNISLYNIFNNSQFEADPPEWYNKWYKKHYSISENFDFDTINKGKKHINIYDCLQEIRHILDERGILDSYQYEILSTQTAFYKVKDHKEL